jgi:hypothetical protein
MSRKKFTNVVWFFVALLVTPRILIESIRCGALTTLRLLQTTYRVYMLMRDDETRENAEAALSALAPAPVGRRDAMTGIEPWPLEHSPVMLVNVHPRENCAGKPCPIHNRTAHALRSWPQFFRQDGGFMERTCQHGVGHPDPDCPLAPRVHGCDGCCRAGDAAELGADHMPEAS